MKDIKIYLIHPMLNSAQKLQEFFQIPDKYNIVWDEKNPDYIIASEWIYKDRKYYQKFLALQNEKTVNIYYAEEAIAPDLNWFDYAIVFDRNLSCDDRIVRMPTIDFFNKRLIPDFWKVCENPQEELKRKIAFCNFIYTNANAHPRRDELFYKLSEYKKVDALGLHLRNVVSEKNFVDEKIKRNYKFTIASENATYKGYTSEKLLTAMQAYTLPIYWGDPSVAESFNPKRFINANEMTLDEVLETVKKIDQNDELWCQMLSEPVMTKEQELKYQKEHQVYLDFWEHLFEQDLKSAKRLGRGTYPDLYRSFISEVIKNIGFGFFDNKKKYRNMIFNKEVKGNKVIFRLFGIKISYKRKVVLGQN